MSKKFSTLMASLLLASAFSANAGDVRVTNASQLIDGATYKVIVHGTDSIMYEGTQAWPILGGSGSYAAPTFGLRSTEPADSLWTLTTADNGGFQLKAKTSPIRRDQDLYANESSKTVSFTFVKAAKSAEGDTLKVGEEYVKTWGTGATLIKKTELAKASAFNIYLVDQSSVTPVDGSALVNGVVENQVLYIVGPDGNYVGVSDLKATTLVTKTAEEFAQLNEGKKKAFAWVNVNGTIKSAYKETPVYLTAGAANTLAASGDKVSVTVTTADGMTTLTAGANTAVISAYSALSSLPYQAPANLEAANPKALEDGKSYFLVANGMAVGADQKLVKYNPADGSQLWQVEIDATGTNSYVARFINLESEEYLTIGGKFVTVEAKYDEDDETYSIAESNGFALQGGNQYASVAGGELAATEDISKALSFGLGENVETPLSAADLIWFEKSTFSVGIKGLDADTKKWTVDLADNYFTGALTPMNYVNGAFEEATKDSDKTFYLKNGDGKYIVATANLADGENTTRAYEFRAISKDELIRDIKREENKYNGKFAFYKGQEVASNHDLTEISSIVVYGYDDSEIGEVGRLNIKGKAYLAVEAGGISLAPIQIKLGSDQIADWKDVLPTSFVQVQSVDAKGASLGYLTALDFWAKESIGKAISKDARNVLETQWAMTFEHGNYVLKNRENPLVSYTLEAGKLYTTSTANKYRYDGLNLVIKPVATAATDGYKRLGDVKNQRFHIGYWSTVYNTNAWFTENHAGTNDHTIGLTIDKENALTWTATVYDRESKQWEEKGTYKDKHLATDSIYVISTIGFYNSDPSVKDYDTKEDTLKVVAYSFKNQYGEPLRRYGSYVASTNVAYPGQQFVLREADDHLILREVNFANYAEDGKLNYKAGEHQTFDIENEENHYSEDMSKVYAGDTKNGQLISTVMFGTPENDLFDVVATDVPMYRKVAKDLDVIAIHRDSNDKETLYESNGFLGLDNTVQFDKIAPAMIADTGMVSNTYRPTYLLAVGATVTPAGKYCPVHGADADCKDEHLLDIPGWVTGRYLVNLKDTAIAWAAANKHKDGNPYTNTEKLYRLGFVKATHINDTLAIAAAKPAAKDSIYVGDGALTAATFAFRYVDQAAGSFVIETANYKTLKEGVDAGKAAGEGYIKWMNGVVVVVPEMKDADIFNMAENYEGEPTANEAIAAEGVQVVGGKGAVTVQGAAGKVITVANILGQTIANQVAASDNVTIAVPAGIVVVAVEGEATKVVVK